MARQYIKNKYSDGANDKASFLEKDVAIKVVPAPIKGLDALSPVAAMEPEYAVYLDNWVPRTGYCEIRGGMNAWCQGLGIGNIPQINTLMTYRPAGGTEKLFAATVPYIYDVSNYGLPTIAVTELTGDKWQYVNFTPSGGSNYLLCVNGSDAYRAYNGSTWSTPTITGVTSSLLNYIMVFKRRVWFVQKNSTSVWYLGTDAIQGAASQLDLGAFMTKGGYVVSMANWTLDGGQGPDDYVVFITSEGQYIVYKGTDPSNASAWAQVGVFDAISPIGVRNSIRFGSDVLTITKQGVLPLSQSLPFDPAASRSTAITNRIQNLMLNSAQAYGNFFGWQLITFPAQGLLIMNVPTLQNSTSVQYVMNLLTGAWCTFSGWNANCFEIYNDSLYFGGTNGNVYLAYTGSTDIGASIQYSMSCAFNYLDEPGRIKNANMVRPFLTADASIIPTVNIDSDFLTTTPTATVVGLSGANLWDSAIWDTATWGQNQINILNWLSCNALGTALSINMAINLGTNNTTSANVFDVGKFDIMTFDGNGITTASGQQIPILRANTFQLSLEYGGPI